MLTFIKFVFVGVLNTAVDLGALNLLVYFYGTGVHNERYIAFKTISFTLGVINSYICNKFWVFKSTSSNNVKEPVIFFVISCIGLIVNVGVSFIAYGYFFKPLLGSSHITITLGALAGSAVVLVWNFIGYKLFVFKKPHVA